MDHDQGRVIGFWRGWSIAVGCAVGSGIFMMPTMLAPYGLLGLSGWLIAGMGSILVALTMSSLVKRIPRTGGPYIYVNEGLGRFSGFIIAWTYWIACVSAIAGISIAFVGYLGFFYSTDHSIAFLIPHIFIGVSVDDCNVKYSQFGRKFKVSAGIHYFKTSTIVFYYYDWIYKF
jgi:amino acid transporter